MKLIVVASDFSGLGKGTFCGALGCLIKAAGKSTAVMKHDLYYNYDAGTINPGEHGEVYVLADGTETDQDLGLYERFLFEEANSDLYLTSGRVHHQIYLNERAGKYLGDTVSVEHVIDEIKQRIYQAAEGYDILIIELGATIGDIKGIFFREAIRQLRGELGSRNLVFTLLSYFPYLSNVGELKTMSCQRSVASLRSDGIHPDFIIARTTDVKSIPEYQIKKIKLFCETEAEDVFCLPDLHDNIFSLPDILARWNLLQRLGEKLTCSFTAPNFSHWRSHFAAPNQLSIALAGKYPHDDAYVSIHHQLLMNGVRDVQYIDEIGQLQGFDGVIIPGGWGERGVERIIQIIKVCRERDIPCLGICLGMQLMVIENARHVQGDKHASSQEFSPKTPEKWVIQMMEEQKKAKGFGGTARLGNWRTQFTANSRIAQIYQSEEGVFRHRHRYEVDDSRSLSPLLITGRDKDHGFVEVIERPDKKFFLGVQFHPEFIAGKSPLITAFVTSCLKV